MRETQTPGKWQVRKYSPRQRIKSYTQLHLTTQQGQETNKHMNEKTRISDWLICCPSQHVVLLLPDRESEKEENERARKSAENLGSISPRVTPSPFQHPFSKIDALFAYLTHARASDSKKMPLRTLVRPLVFTPMLDECFGGWTVRCTRNGQMTDGSVLILHPLTRSVCRVLSP